MAIETQSMLYFAGAPPHAYIMAWYEMMEEYRTAECRAWLYRVQAMDQYEPMP